MSFKVNIFGLIPEDTSKEVLLLKISVALGITLYGLYKLYISSLKEPTDTTTDPTVIIGLTGGICSGKSTACKILKEKGK